MNEPPTTPCEALSVFGHRVLVLAGSQDTSGDWALLEHSLAPHAPGPPLHWHAHTSEAFYVLSGTLTLWVDRQPVRAPPGTLIRVSPGTVHRFLNEESEPLRFLVWLTPAGFEGYYAELAALYAQGRDWPPRDPGVLERLTARYDQHPPLEP